MVVKEHSIGSGFLNGHWSSHLALAIQKPDKIVQFSGHWNHFMSKLKKTGFSLVLDCTKSI
jgi:hypothetical protein